MRAERDDDEYRPVRRKEERRLAYEIAIGIIIGGCVLSVLDIIRTAITAHLMLQQVQINLPF